MGADLSFEQVLATLRRETTPRDLLLTTPFTRDHTGQSFTARESLARITAASAAPTYTPMSIEVGQDRWRAASTPASSTADDGSPRHRHPARASAGGSALETFSWVAYQFDYQQLVRWGVDASRLPAAAVIVGQPRSFYTENQR